MGQKHRLQTMISETMYQILLRLEYETSLSINELVRLAIVNSYVAPVFKAPEPEQTLKELGK